MDIGSAFSFVFEDEQWIGKLVIGALIGLIPIFGQLALIGYSIAIIRSVQAGAPRLPRWENLGQYFVDGLMASIAKWIYAIPFWIFLCPIMLVWVLPALGGEQEELVSILAGISGLVSVALGCLALLYGLLLLVVSPAVQIRYAERGELGACLDFREVVRFAFDNVGHILVVQLVVWVVGGLVSGILSGVVSVLGMIPICGWVVGGFLALLAFPMMTWLVAFYSHLYGQIGRSAPARPPARPPTI